MTPIKGLLDPQAMASWEPLLAKLAAPGMCNPEDPQPRVSGTPTADQIHADTRNIGQRHHDALIAIARNALASGELGKHNGIPTTIIATTSVQNIQRQAGVAVTAGGTLLPMRDLIRMASHANHYLAIFDECTWEPLHLGRTKRLASPAQRLMLHARDLGCTFPGCTAPGYHTQVHHTQGWAKHHGLTNINLEVLACKPHNLLAETGWTVHLRNGHAEWTPPPHLDTGQTRTNTYHHPQRNLKPPDDATDAGHPGTESDPDPPQSDPV
jgi:hypothetical protein